MCRRRHSAAKLITPRRSLGPAGLAVSSLAAPRRGNMKGGATKMASSAQFVSVPLVLACLHRDQFPDCEGGGGGGGLLCGEVVADE